MQLPGGICNGRVCLKSFVFRPVTGQLELAILESQDRYDCVPNQVTSVLLAALSELGGEPPIWEGVHGLCVADRQFLMRRLGILLGLDGTWLTHRCGACEQGFDFFLEPSALPIKPAAPGFPYSEVDTSQGRCRLRALTGADQEAIAPLIDTEAARWTLIQRSVTSLDGKPPETEAAFTEPQVHIGRVDVIITAPPMPAASASRIPTVNRINRQYLRRL